MHVRVERHTWQHEASFPPSSAPRCGRNTMYVQGYICSCGLLSATGRRTNADECSAAESGNGKTAVRSSSLSGAVSHHAAMLAARTNAARAACCLRRTAASSRRTSKPKVPILHVLVQRNTWQHEAACEAPWAFLQTVNRSAVRSRRSNLKPAST